ncbi:MAG: hypothetical protein ACRKGH_09175 [Dehalogenimonas sp.]|uniref:Uncharacterized protein n=1 Tax=Candidatus Dehalogenimonas loeffleri TaxID=3127115 RepID=A0ABZ2J5I7_9CHLR|nr:hypothetical protein [Dehalogenimonas sp.]
MSENKEKEHGKTGKEVEAPPRKTDPKLAQRVDYTEKSRKKVVINIKKEDL